MSTRNEKNDIYWLQLSQCKQSGDVTSAVCGCPAGHGPNGSCKHIAALCYALEEFSRLKTSKAYVACISKLQTWNQPRKRVLDPKNVDNIKFIKLEHGKVYKREHVQPAYDPRPPHLQYTSEEELHDLCSTLHSFNKPCALLHVYTPSSSTMLSTSATVSLPPRRLTYDLRSVIIH